jgi:hypothetical protein
MGRDPWEFSRMTARCINRRQESGDLNLEHCSRHRKFTLEVDGEVICVMPEKDMVWLAWWIIGQGLAPESLEATPRQNSPIDPNGDPAPPYGPGKDV